MLIAIGFALVSVICWILSRGIKSRTNIPALPIVFWPPRIRQFVGHPTSMIGFSYATRVLAGKIIIPRTGYLNDSAVVSASLDLRWNSIRRELIEQHKTNIGRESSRYVYHVESNIPQMADDTGSTISYAMARSLLTSAKATKLSVEAEIVTGLSIAGTRSVRLETPRDEFRWDWGLIFDKSGTHELLVIFRAILSADGVEKVSEIYRTPICQVKVFSILGMTQRQVLYLSGFSGALSIGWVIIQVLSKLQMIH